MTLEFSDEEQEQSTTANTHRDRVFVRTGFALFAVSVVAGIAWYSGARHTGLTEGSVSAATVLSDAGAQLRAAALQQAHQEIEKGSELAVGPKAKMHDGNLCADDEEEFGGLCYAQCSALTQGAKPYRQSAWTCCSEAVCSLRHGIRGILDCCKHDVGFCSGFSVSGAQEGHEACPHTPGACLADEELFMGVCYMKCGLLTGNLYPFRVAPDGCCRSKDIHCIFEDGAKDGFDGMLITDQSLEVGGGCGDGKPGTHCSPHPPAVELTEEIEKN